MVGATQMIPNPKKQMADFNYMNAMSSVEKENKNYTLNQLYALAKTNYHEWMIISKKVKIANENLQLLAYMIKSMEIRYQYNMDKLPTYYKTKTARRARPLLSSRRLSTRKDKTRRIPPRKRSEGTACTKEGGFSYCSRCA